MGDLSLVLLLTSMIALSAPLLLAAMGGLTSERSGVMNIALEGKMLTAACLTVTVAAATEKAWLGLAGGVGAAIVLSALHALLTQAYRLDHIVSGMAINALALGGTNVISQRFLDVSRAAEIPSLGTPTYIAVALVLPLGLALYLARTRGGLRLLAVGNDPDKSRQMGVDPLRVRWVALVGTGVFCGLAGALIASNAGRFSDGMTAGRGFIALAALILGGWRPIPTAIACLVFGLFEALQLQLQGSALMGAQIPAPFWNAMPYVITLIALGGLLGRTHAPAGLGRP